MIKFGMQRSATDFFFDRKVVENAMSRAQREVFGRFGGYVRKTARRSIRKRKRSSDPGKPPSSHTGVLRQNIWFAYEPSRDSVVIGPVPINSPSDTAVPAAGFTVPQLLEEGGTLTIHEELVAWQHAPGEWMSRWMQLSPNRKRRSKKKRTRRVRIAARPYMQPAFEKGQEKLDSFWVDALRRVG